MPESNDDPTPLNPSQPSIPVSYPIKTLEELDSRAYFKSFHYPYNKSNVPLKASALEKRPRILVCHDMQGGYIDDKWVQGHTNEGAYAIWHWYLIDVFVYFSHYLVTLPPPCWTNSAHRHGVKVLGTFITEGDQGREICNTLLATKESAHMYAERLAELSAALGFDGWLLNMEVQLDIKQIPNLKEFVIQLTETMHSSVPGSLVIWYDSVTVDGELFWQNQLNEKNKPFFDISDGILVNYSWEQDYPKLSAAVAGDRRFDVYMGIDVFGRGTYGGGQWDTNVALDVLKKDDVSACLFAPGWVYETKQPPDFQTAQNHWWSLVEKSWGVFNLYPKTLPFYSNFDQGHGYHISVEGEQASNAPWNNISAQGLQPFLKYKNDPNTIQVLVNSKKASYNGGGNITFMGPLAKNTDYTVRLFKGELQLGRSPLYLTYSVNSDINSQLGLSLQFSSTVNERKSVLIAPWSSSKFSEVIVPYQVNKIGVAPGWKIQASSIEMHGYILTEIHAVCYIPKPKNPEREPEYSFDSAGPSDFYAVLGDITIKTTKENTIFPPPNSWQVQARHIKWSSGSAGSRTLSAEIVWNLKDRTGSGYPKYNIYVQKLPKQAFEDSDGGLEGKIQEYIGVANVEAFYISDLSIPSSTSSLKFIIQVCGVDGAIQELNESPSLQLNVEGHQTFIEKLLRIRMTYCFRFCFSFFRGLELGQRKR